jgi:hypothetical protein
LEALPEKFTAARLADAHALQQLEMLVVVSSMKPGALKGKPGVMHPLAARFMLLAALVVSMVTQKVVAFGEDVKRMLAPWWQQRQQRQWEKQQLQLLSRRGGLQVGLGASKAKAGGLREPAGTTGQKLQQMSRPDVFGSGWASLLREPSVPYSDIWRVVRAQAAMVGGLLLSLSACVAAACLKYMAS